MLRRLSRAIVGDRIRRRAEKLLDETRADEDSAVAAIETAFAEQAPKAQRIMVTQVRGYNPDPIFDAAFPPIEISGHMIGILVIATVKTSVASQLDMLSHIRSGFAADVAAVEYVGIVINNGAVEDALEFLAPQVRHRLEAISDKFVTDVLAQFRMSRKEGESDTTAIARIMSPIPLRLPGCQGKGVYQRLPGAVSSVAREAAFVTANTVGDVCIGAFNEATAFSRTVN